MFLDAATFLQGQHILHLEALWGGQLLLGTTLDAKRKAGGWWESPAQHSRRQESAKRSAAKMVSCLQDMSLVQLDQNDRSVLKQLNMYIEHGIV